MENKKVLLIAVPSYAKGITKKLKDLGYEVYFIPDKPNENAITKILGRLKTPLYQKILQKYYKEQIELLPKNDVLYRILIIRGEYTPANTVRLLAERYPSAKRILYMWDSMQNNKKIEQKWGLFDEVYTFDRKDYLNNKDSIRFLPLFYYEDYLPQIKSSDIKYEVSFIGTAHEDRISIINRVFNKLESNGHKCFKYYYLPHNLVFLYNKLTNRCYKGIKKKDIMFKPLPFSELYEIYNKSNCIIDIESSTQTGLTMRTIEIIGLKKKFITTNKDVVNYDFYNENNICVIDRDNPVIDEDFFERPYVNLEERIYKKYALSNWLKYILEGEEV